MKKQQDNRQKKKKKKKEKATMDVTAPASTSSPASAAVSVSVLAPAAIGWEDIPVTIQNTHVLICLDQESLMVMSVVSKQSNHTIRKGPNRIIPVLEFSPSSEENTARAAVTASSAYRYGRTEHLLHNLRRLLLDEETKDKLQRRYQLARVKDVNKFVSSSLYWNKTEFEALIRTVGTIDGITALDLSLCSSSSSSSSSPPSVRPPGPVPRSSLPYALSFIFPNLREINLTNAHIGRDTFHQFSKNCPHLQKITWNRIRKAMMVYLSGASFRLCHNVTDLILDDASFVNMAFDLRNLVDTEERPTVCLFYKCGSSRTRLARVSMRNATYRRRDVPVPQDALIKFVRNGPPTLTWFRSNLTHANMTMLRMERPGIELLN